MSWYWARVGNSKSIGLIAPPRGISHIVGMIYRPQISAQLLTRMCCFTVVALTLAACSAREPRNAYVPQIAPANLTNAPQFATGPISTACIIHDRRAATQARCGCVQAAANLTLSQSEQQRAVRFFAEPELLQAIKASDTPVNERFWDVWDNFADTAEQLCRDT